MKKIIQSKWLAMVTGMLLYFLTTAMLWKTPASVSPEGAQAQAAPDYRASWTFFNPEVEMLVNELKKEKESVTLRQTQLDELATRLQTERQEINQITQKVFQMQKEFDLAVIRVREEESANLKKLAKTYATMTPEGASLIFKQMEEPTMVKIMALMKDSETAPILEAMAKQGEPDAKRVAAISERLRLAIPNPSKKPTP